MDGVEVLKDEKDVLAMMSATTQKRTVCALVDHTSFVWNLRPDMISKSDIQIEEGERSGREEGLDIYVAATQGQGQGNTAVGQGQGRTSSGDDSVVIEVVQDDDIDSDSDFADSDNEIEDGDDDLFLDNVDRDVEDNNDVQDNVEIENEHALDDTNLNLREEDEKQLQSTFKVFNPVVDMDNLVFKLGIVFGSVKMLRGALAAYSVRNKVKVIKVKNDQRRIDAICIPLCPWFLKATKDSRKEGAFTVRKYCGKHTCKGQ
ncbi:hypothetical protein ACQ4PT_063273 [Festuca glaucescens]